MRRRTTLITVILAAILVVVLAILLFGKNYSPALSPSGAGTGQLPVVGTGNSGGSGTGSGNNGGGSGQTTSSSVALIPPQEAASGTVRFGMISNEPTLAYFIDPQNNVTIVEPDGKIAAILDGEPAFLSSTAITDIISASFSHDGTNILVNFGDPSAPQTSVFSLGSKTWHPLPPGAISPVWSPVGDKVAYMTMKLDGSEQLNVINLSSQNPRPVALATLRLQDVSLFWPAEGEIVIADRPSAYEKGTFIIFNTATGAFSRPLVAQAGMETIWSNTSAPDALVFTSGDGAQGGTLSLWDSSTGNLQPLTLLTLPSKCVFNTETAASSSYLDFYCAVPQDPGTFSGAALPDSYDQMSLFTVDTLYKVNASTGALNDIFTPPIPVDATALRVFNGVLFFINRYDRKLYAVSLAS